MLKVGATGINHQPNQQIQSFEVRFLRSVAGNRRINKKEA
jgi:hypothetical protein